MILVCGATGELGGRVARRLAEKVPVRALVRPATDASELEATGIEVVPRRSYGRRPALPPRWRAWRPSSPRPTAIGRILNGARDVTIAGVDGTGNQNLIRAAREAGATRFVFVSAAGLGADLAGMGPLPGAKWAAEQVLAATSHAAGDRAPGHVPGGLARPDDRNRSDAGKALIYGRGETPQRYVAIDDVADLVVHLALADDPPEVVEFGGPEALTRMEVVSRFEQATGAHLKVRHVPRAALSVGQRVLARPKPEIASLMGMALYADTHPATWDDAPLRDAGITPRPASEFIESAALGTRAASA